MPATEQAILQTLREILCSQHYYPPMEWEKRGFPGGSVGRALPAKAGDTGSLPGLGRSPGEWSGSPIQYSCPGNPTDRGDWRATVHAVTRAGHNLAAKHQQRERLRRREAEWLAPGYTSVPVTVCVSFPPRADFRANALSSRSHLLKANTER